MFAVAIVQTLFSAAYFRCSNKFTRQLKMFVCKYVTKKVTLVGFPAHVSMLVYDSQVKIQCGRLFVLVSY